MPRAWSLVAAVALQLLATVGSSGAAPRQGSQRLRSGDAGSADSGFVFAVSDGGGATLTVGSDGANTSVFYMQSQFSQLPTRDAPLWTTLQPPWGGVPSGFVVDRSSEALGRTVVRLELGLDGSPWELERVYQVQHHRILVNDTLTAGIRLAPADVLPVHVQQILSAVVIGSVRDLVLPGALYSYDCNTLNNDRGSFGVRLPVLMYLPLLAAFWPFLNTEQCLCLSCS